MNVSLSKLDQEVIWATRGRNWGFRFLRRGGLSDPLETYEATFSSIGDEPESWCRVADRVGLRFPDPEGRRDASGRIIPHDFVLLGDLAEGIASLEDGKRRIWPQVADEYERIWDADEPPSA